MNSVPRKPRVKLFFNTSQPPHDLSLLRMLVLTTSSPSFLVRSSARQNTFLAHFYFCSATSLDVRLYTCFRSSESPHDVPLSPNSSYSSEPLDSTALFYPRTSIPISTAFFLETFSATLRPLTYILNHLQPTRETSVQRVDG
jgi:hypothetical protein